MNSHPIHEGHTHVHGEGCGHTAILHDGHVDYLHDGHLHSPHGDHVDEHVLSVTAENPAACTAGHACAGHDAAHVQALDAVTILCRTAIMWTTWWMATCTIPTMGTAITTARSNSPD